jgi:hypothetical protein
MTLFRWMYNMPCAPHVPPFALVLAIAALGLLTGCDDETVGPDTRGTVSGHVLDAASEEPVARAEVSTSPATQSVLTDREGRFVLENIPTGTYTIEASKDQFEPGNTNVRVSADNDTTRATILLERSSGPQTRGVIEGQVFDATSDAPIDRARVATDPPTQSVLTDREGRFMLDITAGDYTLVTSKDQYETDSTAVSVEAGDTTQAFIPLQRTPGFGDKQDSLAVVVTDLFNERVNDDNSGPDSVFANVEYEARNVGEVKITAYEILFRLVTDDATFSQEEVGDTLLVGEFDVGSFRRFVRESPVDEVRVDDVFVETEPSSKGEFSLFR